jgi:hypothetical protein
MFIYIWWKRERGYWWGLYALILCDGGFIKSKGSILTCTLSEKKNGGKGPWMEKRDVRSGYDNSWTCVLLCFHDKRINMLLELLILCAYLIIRCSSWCFNFVVCVLLRWLDKGDPIDHPKDEKDVVKKDAFFHVRGRAGVVVVEPCQF